MPKIVLHDERQILVELSRRLCNAGLDVQTTLPLSGNVPPCSLDTALILWAVEVPNGLMVSDTASATGHRYILMGASHCHSVEVIAAVGTRFESIALAKIQVMLQRDVTNPYRPHAVVRWANALAPVLGSPTDPRTIADWARIVFSSPGALRNWCYAASMSPRRSLIFARLLRAISASRRAHRRPEQLLDVVDARTIRAMLASAGFKAPSQVPSEIDEFIDRQRLIVDPTALAEVRTAISEYTNRQRIA